MKWLSWLLPDRALVPRWDGSPRSLREVAPDRLGYYGLQRQLMYLHDEGRLPDWLWRVYWWFQPLRCLLGYHHWYDTAAGMCVACRCGAEDDYPEHLMQRYRWDRHARDLARAKEEAEHSAEVMREAWFEAVHRFADHLDKYPLTGRYSGPHNRA